MSIYGFIINQAMKLPGKIAGKAITGQMFNELGSCDGINNQGDPCCYNKKEAEKKGVPSCYTRESFLNPSSNNSTNRCAKSGGIDFCTHLTEMLVSDEMTVGYFDDKLKGSVGVGDGDITKEKVKLSIANTNFEFSPDVLWVSLLSTINGHNYPISIDLRPEDGKLIRTLEPWSLLHTSSVGKALTEADLLLKRLSRSEEFDFETTNKLKTLGYRSIIEIRKDYDLQHKSSMPTYGRSWIEPIWKRAIIDTNGIELATKMVVCYEIDIDLPWLADFYKWFNLNLTQFCAIFPCFAVVKELMDCTCLVEVMRKFDFPLYSIENLAIKMLPRAKEPIQVTYPLSDVSLPGFIATPNGSMTMYMKGGIVFNSRSSNKQVFIKMFFDGDARDITKVIKSKNNQQIRIPPEMIWRMRLGFLVEIDDCPYSVEYVRSRVAKYLNLPISMIHLFNQSEELSGTSSDLSLRFELIV